MSFTYAGIFAILIGVGLFFKYGLFRMIINPLFIIVLRFFSFFGTTESFQLDSKSQFLLLLSWSLFLFSYYFSNKGNYSYVTSYISKQVNYFGSFKLSPLTMNKELLMLLFILLYCVYDLVLNTILYGSFDNAFTRFYVKQPIIELPTYFTSIQFFMYSAAVGLLFIIRLSNTMYRQNSFIYYIAFLCLLFVAFPRGSRGAVGALFLVTFFADVLAFIIQNENLRNLIFRVSFLFPLFTVVFMFFLLSNIRGKEFTDINQLKKEILVFDVRESVRAQQEEEQDLILKDYALTVHSFGHTKPYCSLLFTVKSIIFNPIPRFLWSGKPVGFGVVLSEVKMGGNNFSIKHLSEHRASFAAGVAGEGWANYGLIGLIFYSVLMGIYAGFLGKISQVFLVSSNFLSLMVGVLFLQAATCFVRGDLLSGVTQGLYPILFFFIVLKLFIYIKHIRIK